MTAINSALQALSSFFGGLPAVIAGNWHWFALAFVGALVFDSLISRYQGKDGKFGKWSGRLNGLVILSEVVTGGLLIASAVIPFTSLATSTTAIGSTFYSYWPFGAAVALIGVSLLLSGLFKTKKSALIPGVPAAIALLYVAVSAVAQIISHGS